MNEKTIANKEYIEWISSLKAKIRSAKTRVALSVNSAVIELYWEIGKEIYKKQETAKWGSKVVEQIARDLKGEFSDMKGLSRRNIYAMRQFYLFYSNEFEFVPQSVAQIPKLNIL